MEAFKRIVGCVDRLEAELAQLRQELATEVRTRRVVVVTEQGDERIVLRVDDRLAEITVNGQDDDAPSVVIYTADEMDDPIAGIIIPAGDYEVTKWETTGTRTIDAPEANFSLDMYPGGGDAQSNGGLRLHFAGVTMEDTASCEDAVFGFSVGTAGRPPGSAVRLPQQAGRQ